MQRQVQRSLLGERSWQRLPPPVYRALMAQLLDAPASIGWLSALIAIFVGSLAAHRSGDIGLLLLALLTCVCIAALILYTTHFRRRLASCSESADIRRRERRYEWLAWSSSLCLGMMALRALLGTDDPVVHLMLISLCLGATCATVRSHYRPRVAVGKLCGLCVPAILGLFARGEVYYAALGMGAAAAFVVFLKIFGELYGNSEAVLIMADEQTALLRQLEDRTAHLRQAEERYRLAARATNDVIWDWDIATDRVQWNAAAGRYLGEDDDRSETPHSAWVDRLHPEDRPRVLDGLERAMADGSSLWSHEYRFRDANGEFADIFDRGFIMRGAGGKAVRAVGAMLDVTEARSTQRALEQAQAELIHVSRYSAMGAMASTLAHELNQPLTAITAYLYGAKHHLRRAGAAGAEAALEAVAAAAGAAIRAGTIVKRLRELAERERLGAEGHDLAAIVSSAINIALPDPAADGITVRVDLEEDARAIRIDRVQIEQVLINLLRNGVQALAQASRKSLHVTSRRSEGDMIEVSVSDSGAGLDPSRRQQLFEAFNAQESGGYRLGLPISRTIVEAHGGQIWADAAEPDGTVFRFTVPAEPKVLQEVA